MDSESERAGRQPGLSRRSLLHGVPLALLGGCSAAAPPSPAPAAPPPKRAGPRFALRLRAEQLRNPFWYEANGDRDAARDFWDMNTWERRLSALAGEGYNAVFYVPEPWQQHAWQTFLIRHDEFPEARDLAVEQYDRLIAQVRRIFRRARDLGLKNFLWSYFSVTTPGFARAHGLDREMPLSESVDQRHNPPAKMGWHFGVRNEITRAFTEAAIAEVFKTYPDLDGLCGAVTVIEAEEQAGDQRERHDRRGAGAQQWRERPAIDGGRGKHPGFAHDHHEGHGTFPDDRELPGVSRVPVAGTRVHGR